MALQYFKAGIAAYFGGGRTVTEADFVKPLSDYNPLPTDFATIFDRRNGVSSQIIFSVVDIRDYSSIEPYEEFHRELSNSFQTAASWMSGLDKSLLDELSDGGLKTWIFFEGWINQDQIDLSIPLEFISEAGKLGLPINLNTNE